MTRSNLFGLLGVLLFMGKVGTAITHDQRMNRFKTRCTMWSMHDVSSGRTLQARQTQRMNRSNFVGLLGAAMLVGIRGRGRVGVGSGSGRVDLVVVRVSFVGRHVAAMVTEWMVVTRLPWSCRRGWV